MRAFISEEDNATVRRWLRLYALCAVGVWLVSVWVCVRAAAPRPNAIFAPPLDGLPLAICGVVVFGVAAIGAARRRTWGGYVGLFGGLCALAYQVITPYELGRMMSLRYTLTLAVATAVVHVPVVALSVRRDPLAGTAWAALMVLLAGGGSLGWALGLRAYEACDGGPIWQQELACSETTLFWREQGRRAARNDAARGVYRVLASGLYDDDAIERRRFLRSKYGVQTDVVASCLVSNELLAYERGFDEVARPRLERHLEPFGGWSGVDERWSTVQQAFVASEQLRTGSEDAQGAAWVDQGVPLDPPPPRWNP